MQHSANEFLKAFVEIRQSQGGSVDSCADELGMNKSLLRNFITARSDAHWHQEFVQQAIKTLKTEAEPIIAALSMVPKP
jgi:hypothetical protein